MQVKVKNTIAPINAERIYKSLARILGLFKRPRLVYAEGTPGVLQGKGPRQNRSKVSARKGKMQRAGTGWLILIQRLETSNQVIFDIPADYDN